MDLTFSGSQLLIGFILLIALIAALIIFIRYRFGQRAAKANELSELHAGQSRRNPLEDRNKYHEVDAFRWSGPLFNTGLAISLIIIILAFNYTTYEEVVDFDIDLGPEEEEIEMEPPRTAEPPPPPPPPPPPVIEEVPEEEIEEEEYEVVDQTIDEETFFEEVPIDTTPKKKEEKPVIKKKEEPKEPEIFVVVEEQPRFPGCEKETDKIELKKCSDLQLKKFLKKHLKYPPIAKENGIQGKAIVRFVVDEQGKVSKAQVLKDPGGGLGEEALRVVQLMNDMKKPWVPGKQRGKPVKVWFTLPVDFKLQ